jgi:hypothetical protein
MVMMTREEAVMSQSTTHLDVEFPAPDGLILRGRLSHPDGPGPHQRPEVDADRIGLWGSSYAGGHALVLGATGRRLKAVVAQHFSPYTTEFAKASAAATDFFRGHLASNVSRPVHEDGLSDLVTET